PPRPYPWWPNDACWTAAWRFPSAIRTAPNEPSSWALATAAVHDNAAATAVASQLDFLEIIRLFLQTARLAGNSVRVQGPLQEAQTRGLVGRSRNRRQSAGRRTPTVVVGMTH